MHNKELMDKRRYRNVRPLLMHHDDQNLNTKDLNTTHIPKSGNIGNVTIHNTNNTILYKEYIIIIIYTFVHLKLMLSENKLTSDSRSTSPASLTSMTSTTNLTDQQHQGGWFNTAVTIHHKSIHLGAIPNFKQQRAMLVFTNLPN